MKAQLLLLALGALAVTAPAYAADPAPQPAGKAAQWRAADANGDGALDKAEWLAAGRREQGFIFLDADKNGRLTPAEIQAGRDRMRQMRGAAPAKS